MAKRRALNPAQRVRTDNAGVLVASGLIAGEALMGLLLAGYSFFADRAFPSIPWDGALYVSIVVFFGLAVFMIFKPLGSAGAPDEPPPPSAVM
jgi:hypothetical protein